MNICPNQILKFFVVDYESQADLKVFKVDYKSQAIKNYGLWYFVNYKSDADKKIYFVDYKSQADLKIFFVKYKSQAGWNENSKNICCTKTFFQLKDPFKVASGLL